jgi:hypothetical protein
MITKPDAWVGIYASFSNALEALEVLSAQFNVAQNMSAKMQILSHCFIWQSYIFFINLQQEPQFLFS